MDVVEKRRPQDGRIKTRTADGQDVELRLSTLPTAFGEKLVMRVFDPEVIVKDFAELGFSEDDKTRWKQMTGQPNGIILVTGPTGSGKTTTLYSTLKTFTSDRKSTRLNSSHSQISYAVFCLKKKKDTGHRPRPA